MFRIVIGVFAFAAISLVASESQAQCYGHGGYGQVRYSSGHYGGHYSAPRVHYGGHYGGGHYGHSGVRVNVGYPRVGYSYNNYGGHNHNSFYYNSAPRYYGGHGGHYGGGHYGGCGGHGHGGVSFGIGF